MKLPSALRTIVIAAVLGGVQPPLIARAERDAVSVVYHGVPLEVDELRSAGGDLLKVVLAGQAFLVSESDAPRQVALRYLANQETSSHLSGAHVQAIALAAARVRDRQVLTAVASVGLVQEQAKEFDTRDVWQQIAFDAETAAAVWSGVSGLVDRAPTGRVCHARAAVGRVLADDAAQLQVIRPVAERCVRQAMQRALEAIMAGREALSVVEDLRRESGPFVPQAGALGGELATLEGAIAPLTQAFEQLDARRFEESVQVLRVKSESLGVQYDVASVRQSFIVRAVAGRALRVALEQLAQVTFEARSSKTHSQLVVALRELPASDWTVLLDPNIRPALLRYITKDEEIYSQWVTTQRRMIVNLVERGDVESAHRLADMVRQEDPDIAAQVLTVAAPTIVEGYLDQGNVARAAEVARDMVPHPSLMLRLTLLLAGWGISLPQLAGGVCALSLLGIIWRRARRNGPEDCAVVRESAAKQSRSASREEHLESDVQRHGVAEAGDEQQLFSAEYVAALQIFGLQPGATLSQIKNAYRIAVKQHHPDLKREGSQEDTTLFIRLTSEYERLLELHEREAIEPQGR
jgi:hypothetical protein